jgi:hypothetical protein
MLEARASLDVRGVIGSGAGGSSTSAGGRSRPHAGMGGAGAGWRGMARRQRRRTVRVDAMASIAGWRTAWRNAGDTGVVLMCGVGARAEWIRSVVARGRELTALRRGKLDAWVARARSREVRWTSVAPMRRWLARAQRRRKASVWVGTRLDVRCHRSGAWRSCDSSLVATGLLMRGAGRRWPGT